MELKQALDETVLTYSARAFSLTEQLNNTGKPIPEYMLVTAYKRGLRDEYEGVLTAVNAREVAPCMQDLMTMLCAHENMLLAKSSRSQPTAMAVVHGKPGRPPIWERSSGGGKGSRSPGGGGSGSGSWRGSGGGDGGSWRGGGDGGRPKERVCFRCHQPGHLAAECRAPAPVPRPQAAEAPAGGGKESPEGIFFALMASGGAVSDTRPVFLLDTCASHHVAGDLSLFVAGSYVETPDAATVVGVGGPCRPEGLGDVLVMSAGPERSYSLLLRDVLHVPSMGAAVLVGWHKLQQAGVQFEVVQNGFLGMMQGHCIMQAVWQAGVPMLHMQVKRPEDRRVEERDGSAMAFAITDEEVMRLHRRLAHMGLTGLQNMAREEAVMDFPEISRTATLSCDACHMGKMKSLPFGDSTTKYEPGEALSFDISGKLPQGYNGNQYFGVGVDHGSRYCIVNTFTLKSEAGPFVKSTATRFSVIAERKPTLLRTDNGCELITGDNLRWMQDNGVQDQQSAPYTPAQNDIAERHIGKIKTQSVTMLIDAGLDVKYWPDAVMAAGLLTNLKVSHGSKTPHELITGGRLLRVACLIVHVDDMLLGGDKLVVDRAKSGLGAKFTIKDLGAARLFLGMEVTRDRVARTLTLTQYKMSVDLLHTFSMSKSKAVAVPMVAGLDRLEGEPFVDGSKYRSLVGSLMYLAVSTRPDLAHTATSLGRYSHSPTKPQWEAAQHVLRFLNGTVNLGIKFGGGADHGLVGFVDSDYAGDESDRKSRSGYVFLSGAGPISWSSVTQATVALSTCEAEYYAAGSAAKEALFLRQLMVDFGGPLVCVPIHIDNQSALAVIGSIDTSRKLKHIDVRYHFIRDRVQKKHVRFDYVSTDQNAADFFTKVVPAHKFKLCRDMIGMM
ncbi:hypothetical protein FOA52_010638 [Chlamydomonas sp. UWO 241]|nr:hypothetical protein FOA52_010638 [Chlamydomonas sp. UWO 241]